MENITTNHALKKTLADQLLYKFTEEYPEILKMHCNRLGYDIQDLHERSASRFKEKGTPSDTKNIRYIHHEEGRLAKIIKVAKEVADDIKCIL